MNKLLPLAPLLLAPYGSPSPVASTVAEVVAAGDTPARRPPRPPRLGQGPWRPTPRQPAPAPLWRIAREPSKSTVACRDLLVTRTVV